MRRLATDLRFALRSFAKTPGFTAIAVVVLGIGIGANTAIFTVVNELLLRPLSGRANELVGVYNHDRAVPNSYRPFSYPLYTDVRDRSGIFDALMAHTFSIVGTPAGEGTKRTLASVVSSNYFDVLGVRLAAGRTFSAEEERPGARIPVAIVTYGQWLKAGLDPAFLGRTIRINAMDFTIVGVAPQGFTGTMALISADLYVPLGMFDSDRHRSVQEQRPGPGRSIEHGSRGRRTTERWRRCVHPLRRDSTRCRDRSRRCIPPITRTSRSLPIRCRGCRRVPLRKMTARS